MNECLCKTKKNIKCKLKSSTSVLCYGIEIPVCSKHKKINAIYEWSIEKRTPIIPEKIFNFLKVYDLCKSYGMNDWMSVQIAYEFKHVDNIYNSDNILYDFFKKIFKSTKPNECSICYESKRNTIITRCNHYYCRPCITKWCKENNECPMCRKLISGIITNDY